MEMVMEILVYIILGAIIFMAGWTVGQLNGYYKGWDDGYDTSDKLDAVLTRSMVEHNRKMLNEYHELLMEYVKAVKGDR